MRETIAFFDEDAQAFIIVDEEGRTAVGETVEACEADYMRQVQADAVKVWELPRIG